MAGDKEDKKKKSKAADGEKVKKEKSSDKDKKGDKKDKKTEKPDKKDKKSSSTGDKLIDRKIGADKKGPNAVAAAPPRPKPRGPPPPKPSANDSYLGDIDLPPSESESDEEVERRQVDDSEKIFMARTSGKEAKKLADKERKIMEKAAAAKAAALHDDDNVFDVSFEKQGDGESTLSATDIKVHNMTIRAKGKILLENTTLTIAAGRRYGLVGPNGKGKSTLLRMIARRQIPVPENLDVLLVEQEVVGTEASALESVVAADVELMALRAEEAVINEKLGALDLGNDSSAGTGAGTAAAADEGDLAGRLTEIYEKMAEIGGASAEARASKILHGLGFSKDMQARATNLFSGGWRMRISLARALYIQPTVLLLDEPTNHLDLRAVLWLEEYLTRWKKTLIVVSHDRDFLNSITTDIIHLHDERLHYYRGNFAQFEEMYEQRRREVNKEFEKYQKQMKAAKKSGSKANADKVDKAAKHKAKKNEKRGGGGVGAEKYSTADGPAGGGPRQWADYTVTFEFPEPTELPPPLLQLIDADFKYPNRDDFGLKNLNIGIDMGSRIAIVGPNGAGKTTLMNLLAGDLEPTHGEQRKSHRLRVGRYNQHFVDALSFDTSPVEYLMNKYPTDGLKPEDMRAKLGKFGLSGHHHLQPICKLSGGQKARVVFAAIALSNAHILLLDEPTNHLDMQSIDALADALEVYEGGVIIISHDSRLLSRVCDDAERAEVWIVEDGHVENYDGDFEDYKSELIKEIAAELDADEREAATAAAAIAGKSGKQTSGL
jgi:ATP-binding cassette subfamily F protein 1